ncbi:N-methyl-L-tryptophan oxidase [Microbacterium sp. cx-59]|uniref:N-methyl-L-tryptophan oxidase n=1 Tax=Microbacterium sp. cx-59 TaxID=2891207 RepID=UPI001E515A60|nr:N-methyl-L-tryptophan oxidase [Microbacterium sp. cx-59]MCC4908901.1 N-methyl-L-tryptophan oxidase [Microbacterium sp. cx-59]
MDYAEPDICRTDLLQDAALAARSDPRHAVEWAKQFGFTTGAKMADRVQTIVVGAGAIGSAAAYWLAARGQTDVLVLEQFDLAHGRGSADDHSRIIRHSYHNSHYGRLTSAAYGALEAVERESGQQLVFETGGLDLAEVGTVGANELANYRSTLAENGHTFEELNADAVRRRFPQWNITDSTVGLYSSDSGILDIRRSRATHISLARARGVTFAPNTAVRRIESIADGVRVFTDGEVYEADHVVLCTASWTETLTKELGQEWKIWVTQEQVSYFATPNVRDFSIGQFPLFMWHGDVPFYGFPIYGEVGVKVSRDVAGKYVSADTRSFDPDPAETELFLSFLRDHLPGAIGPEIYSKTCIYDMPVDRDFIIDTVPGHPRVVLGLGAGHAAKFSGLIGEIVSDLVVDGATRHPIAAFRADRPTLSDPTLEPSFRQKG